MDVLNDFLFHVFDKPMDPHEFIKGSDVILDRVFDHPLLIENAIFHYSYRHFFGIFASPTMFQQRAADTLASPCFEFIHIFGTSVEKYPTFIATIKNHLTNKEFRKTFVFTKLGERRGVPFNRTRSKQNVLLFFVNLPKPHPPPTNNINPITKKRVIYPSPCSSFQDVIMNDRQFLMKFLQRPVIVVHCQTPVTILNALIKCLPPNVLILDLTESLPANQLEAVCYPIQHHLYQMLPAIASIFILVSNALHPPVKSLTQNNQSSIYYMRAWDAIELEENLPTFNGEYCRILTNMPSSLPTSPLPVYRVYDIIENTPSSPGGGASTHIIKGKRSSIKQDTAGCRVTTYTPTISMSQPFTHIVDDYGEIPTPDIYKLAITNKIKASNITTAINIGSICAPLFSLAMFQNIWRAHLASPLDNVVLFYEFLHSYFERVPKIRQHIPAFSAEPTKTTLVLLDNRENPLSVISIMIALTNITSPMTCHVFTNNKSLPYYKQHLAHLNVNVIDYPDLNIAHFNIDVYNQILKSTKFWQTLKGSGVDKVIIIQDDGVLARPGIEALLPAWDYIGAPWADVPGNEYIRDNFNAELVGNGGFSTRDVAKCLHITEKYEDAKHQLFFQNLVEIPEDVYFVMSMVKEGFKIAPRAIAGKLSSEQVLDNRSLGFHKPWAYTDRASLQHFLACLLHKHDLPID